MPFLSRRKMRWLGKRTFKHVITSEFIDGNAATRQDVVLANAVDSPAAGTSNQCAVLSRIQGINLDLNFAATAANVGTLVIYWEVGYLVSGQNNPAPNAVGTSNQRAQIFIQGQECLTPGSTAKRIGFVKVPPKWSKMSPGSNFTFSWITPLGAVGTTYCVCLKAIYKEIRG